MTCYRRILHDSLCEKLLKFASLESSFNNLRNFFIMKNKFSYRILTGEVYSHRLDLTFNSLITSLDYTTSEGGEIERQQHRAVCRVNWFKRRPSILFTRGTLFSFDKICLNCLSLD